MSGISAVWTKENPRQVAAMLGLVNGGMALDVAERIDTRVDQDAGVGVSSRSVTQQIYGNNRVLVVCDADLHNIAELRALTPSADQVSENAQIAALLASLYERFGPKFVEKLRGGFSVILWDCRQRKLIAAIDGFGIKRLVYFQNSAVLLLGSRIDGLMQSNLIERAVNPHAIVNILNFSTSLAPETIYTRVQRLIPGGLLIASDGQVRVEKYWDMSYLESDESEARLTQSLEAVVEQAVATLCQHAPFDELGAFLSGGTDSSTVVGMMSRLRKGHPRSFSIGFENEQYNELQYAAITASRFQADHHTYSVSAEDCFKALPQMVRFFDEPFGNSSSVPTYFCARLASQNGVKTLLAGDGGDELFAGNEWYRTEEVFELYQKVPRWLRRGLIEPFLGVVKPDRGYLGKARRYVRRSNLPSPQRILSYNFLCANPASDVFEDDFAQAISDYSVLEVPRSHYHGAPADNHLNRLLYMDVKMTLGDSDLPKVTLMAEMAGIRVRFPFLERDVAEFSGRIPAHLKLRGREKRYLFKRAFRNLLPPEVIKKKKHGFGIPVAHWLKSDPRLRELARDTLLSSRSFERGYFRRSFIEGLFGQHETDKSDYYGDMLWVFLTLEMWHRQFVDEGARLAV